jgi:hypothetical protein
MPIPEIAIAAVKRFCCERVPAHALHEVRIEVEVSPKALTIVERWPPWRPEMGSEWSSVPVARLRYTAKTKLWTLYWRDRNLAFHLYDLVAPSPSIDPLLAAVDVDETCIFWG